MRYIALMLMIAVAGCGTKFGYRMGDMTYVHKPRCPNPAKEWAEADYAPIKAPSRKRVGGVMAGGTAVPTEGHWHYYC